jgi:TonB family protein
VVEPALIPIEIVSKPRPLYTAEARRIRLEGEVVLEVRFQATGQPRVLRVVKGLGHGLDEEAVRAAEQIQFKPARREGHAVDYTATVRMVFQLA